MGRGAYGIVWKSKEKATGRVVALKKVFDAFQNATDAQRTYREVMYLQQLNNHENIIKLYSIIPAKNHKDLYLVFEIMESDVHVVIRGRLLKSVHKQYIMYQLMKSLKYLHSADLIHRDLKPSNMLINSDCLMKLADFGLARSVAEENGEPPLVSDYIATRWYRAPEILFGSQKYSKSVDVWSSGCIFAEILLEKVLFPGKSSLNQIELIIELLGRPSENDLVKMNSDLAWTIMQNIKTRKRRSISKMFAAFPSDAVDLLRKLLAFNPDKR
jgi:mitogen-activated protein kinase 15